MRGGVTYEMSSTCVQQGSLHPRPLGGYQPTTMMMEPASAWNYHSVVPKQEPRDEERNNDSGINSGSDFHLSSPGSETSQDLNMQFQSPPQPPPTIYRNINPLLYYQYQQQFGADTAPAEIKTEQTYIDNNNTVTAPESPKASWSNETLPKTPSSTTSSHSDGSEDPLRRLQMTLEKNGLLPPALSPKLSECSGGEDEMKSDNDMDEFDEQGIRIPKVNSHGKVKTFKCKQCDYIAVTKLDFWEHTKGHIKADKLLTCPKCPFVTEYKHHLEYHLRNHFGSKPFKCTQCNYSCVNKSMLNSHLKSHSNIYQYRCADCSYATKYCHSLKLHLRKYQHKPAMVLNPDGTPNPLPIIDVYGTRRGPKVKSQVKQEDDQPTQSSPSPNHPQLSPKPEQLLPFALNQLMMNSSTPQMQLPFPYPFFGGFPGGMPNPLFLQNLERLTRHQRQEDSVEDEEEGEEEANDTGVLDLSKPEAATTKNRRKGRAFKLASMPSDEEIEEDEEMTTTMFSNVEVVQNKSEADEDCSQEKPHLNNNNNKEDYCCQYCTINFGDAVLYTMHMGYHGYKNPFTCNMCGEECKDKVSFFLHIARTPHS